MIQSKGPLLNTRWPSGLHNRPCGPHNRSCGLGMRPSGLRKHTSGLSILIFPPIFSIEMNFARPSVARFVRPTGIFSVAFSSVVGTSTMSVTRR
jgi:hypothetical protein